KGAEHRPGFFDTYEKGENLYLVIPQDRLGQDFLMEFKIAQGVGANRLFGGTMLSLFEANLVTLERYGDRVFLLQRPHRFTAREGGAAAKAVALTFSPSVLEAAKIESIREDSAVVINIYDWIVSDLSGIGQSVRQVVSTTPGRPGVAAFEKPKSYLESVKAFPHNVNIRAKLTFRPGEPVGWASVPDGRYISLSLHYTIAALPENPMTPRLGDDRVGQFWTIHKDFSQEDSSAFVRYVNRWRLEPGERVGDLIRPKKPIVYYIDPNVPEEYRQPFKDGVEAWNSAFEAAGWKDAIKAEMLPEGVDPEDIRYPTLRWNVSDAPGYGAIGPSVVDPRTGEILDADILFEANMFVGFRNAWRTLVNPQSAADAFLSAIEFPATDMQATGRGLELASFGTALAMQGGFLQAVLAERGEIAPGTPVPMTYVNEAVKWVTMHEVGHTLGLQHNFRSSISTPFDKLHDRAWAERNGVFSSVMEYPTPNVAPRGKPNGFYYNPNVGSWDRWAIAYSYTPDDARARALARQVADSAHLFGTNAEAGGPGALDPSINVYDLSADPLAWARERTSIIRELWGSLPRVVLADNVRYHELTVAFQSLMGQYAQAMAPAVKYIGGHYINRDHAGDPNGRPPLQNVPRAKQREALQLLVDRVFGEEAIAVPSATLAQLGTNRWIFDWGSNLNWNGRLDYPFHEQVLGFQSAVLAQTLHPLRLARIRDAETKFGRASVITIPELMDQLTSVIWSEVWAAPGRNVTALRRDLQRAHLDQLTQLVAMPPERLPADARAVARQQLAGLDRRLAARLQPPARFDGYTTAHLQEARARIKLALEAGLEVERR
ncbi:MAG TPA: zinc-dependent metalloprotease, partial [Gemmatimonadales bacterium]